MLFGYYLLKSDQERGLALEQDNDVEIEDEDDPERVAVALSAKKNTRKIYVLLAQIH